MEESSPEITPFVFSDPAGKRWPRLRLVLLIVGILVFLGTVLFLQTLFVAPQLNLPFSLRQLKGQLKALGTVNPAGQAPPNLALWEKFAAARTAGKKLAAERSAPRVLRQWRSLQLHVAGTTRVADHPCLSGMDGDDQWRGRFGNRRGQPAAEARGDKRFRAHAAADESRRRHLAAGSSRESCPQLDGSAGPFHPESARDPERREGGRRHCGLGADRSGLQERHHRISRPVHGCVALRRQTALALRPTRAGPRLHR